MGKKARCLSPIDFKRFAKISRQYPFFTDSEAIIYENKYGKENQGQQGRPMQQPSEYDEKKACILRVPDGSINSVCDQSLGPVNFAPAQNNQHDSNKRQPGTGDHAETAEQMAADGNEFWVIDKR